MTPAEVSRRAATAIRLAFSSDERGHEQLLAYVSEMSDEDLNALYDAADHLADAAMDVLARRRAS
jgi:hypothetical protein